MRENSDPLECRRLLQRHGAALALYARQWCRFPEDAVQEAMVDLIQSREFPKDPVAWLFRTVRCKALNISRAESRRSRHHSQAAQERSEWFVSELENPLPCGEVQRLLESLPELEREIVIARIWGELTFEQIANVVAQSLSAVHRRYQQALALLGKSMNADLERWK